MDKVMKCYNTDCSRYDESKEQNCYDLNDASLCEDFHESKLRTWRTTRPGKEILCVVIIDFDSGPESFVLTYRLGHDSFSFISDGVTKIMYHYSEVKCWIEYPEELIK